MSDSNLRRDCERIDARIGAVFDLPETGAWPATRHRLDEPSARAIIAAVAAGRPLLVRGEPGVGKSQLARAAAYLLERPFLATVVQPDSEYQELLWAMDHTKRLADAQLAAHADEAAARVADPGNYIGPGALWWAFHWDSAAYQGERCHHNFNPARDVDAARVRSAGCVLLIDEIDKADIALANGLLEVLGNGQFAVPPLGSTVKPAAQPPPLVVLTSNDMRQLPAPLLRRCVVLHMCLPEDLQAHFVERGRTHFEAMDEDVLAQAAAQVLEDRSHCSEGVKTGLAEYLDLLRTLDRLAPDPEAQLAWLDKLGGYFRKSEAVAP